MSDEAPMSYCYANSVEVSISENDVVLTCNTNSPSGPISQPTVIFLSWRYAKKLAITLNEFVARYERAVGEVPIEVDLHREDSDAEGQKQAAVALEEMTRDS